MVAVLQVNDDGHVQVLVARSERQGAAGHTVAHPGVLRQGFTQVTPDLWVRVPRSVKTDRRYTLSPEGSSRV